MSIKLGPEKTEKWKLISIKAALLWMAKEGLNLGLIIVVLPMINTRFYMRIQKVK